MGVEMTGEYQGHFRCEMSHGPSGSKIITDAPKDNMGQGLSFSPTDLMAAALGSCILTTMAIIAQKEGFEFHKGRFRVVKEMSAQPRQISELRLQLLLDSKTPAAVRTRLQEIAVTCPAHRSLASSVKIPIDFHWDLL